MLILLPPSEGKAAPRRGRPLSVDGPLAEPRLAVIEALEALCRGPEGVAVATLGLGPTQADDVRRDARLRELPSAPAEKIYSGVLYDALGLTTLGPPAHRRALARLAVVSSVYGVVRPGERIAPYRLAGGVTLPGLGGVAAHWRAHLDPVLRDLAGRGLVVDLRSSTYAAFWRPAADLAPRVVTVRVLHETNGKRQVVSHFNKATKGRLVRALLEDGRDARTPAAFAALLTDLGWTVEVGPATKAGTQLDVVVGGALTTVEDLDPAPPMRPEHLPRGSVRCFISLQASRGTCDVCGLRARSARGRCFCPACGTRQEAASCDACAAELTPGAAFCFRCGSPVAGQVAPAVAPRAAERRLSSILFADLVSYTTLSESRDQEDVRELLTGYFDVCSTVVRRYGGTVEKFIGDAVMAVWGVPTAHEDDAERAVRAATELIDRVAELGQTRGIPDLRLRAGVVTGEVAVTLGATDQGMVAGDPVNTAARVQSAAGPGEVWVDATTRSLTEGGVTYLDVGEHALKGKAEPMQLYKVGTIVAAVGGSQRVDGLEAPLSGRERELRLVKELFHGTVESGRPRMVILDGEAGIGKTRLAWEFEKYVSGIESDTYWHRGRCLSYGDGVAYWALAEAVRTRLGLVDDTSAADIDLDTLLAQWVHDSAERDWIRPRLATLIGLEVGEFEREDLFAAWARFFERLGDDSESVTLVIDDAQNADDGLVAFLEHLMANARTSIFVLLLTRPELLDEHPHLGGRRTARVPLEPLNDVSMNALVDALVEGLPESTRTALVSRAEGIPLFAVETVRALIDRDLVRPEGGRYMVAPGAELDLSQLDAPASLHALVAARLDALTTDERRVVADASVLGATFTHEGISLLCGDVPDLDSVLTSLQRKEIIGTETDRFSAERGQFRFVQSVVHQVAYATLSRRDRKQRHLDVAAHLERAADSQPEVILLIARHLVDAVEASAPEDPDVAVLNERAAELLLRAAQRSARLGATGDALRLFQDAASRMSDGLPRADALTGASAAAHAIGRYDEAFGLAERASGLFGQFGTPEQVAVAETRMAGAKMVGGDIQGALIWSRQAWETIRDVPGADAAKAQAATLLSRLLNRTGTEPDQEAVLMAEALRRSEASGDVSTMVITLNHFALTQSLSGSLIVSRAISREVAELSRTHEQWQQLINSTMNLSLLERVNSLDASLAVMVESLGTQAEHGYSRAAGWANLATTLWLAGRWSDHARINADALEELPQLTPGDHVLLYAADQWRREAGLAPTFEARHEGSSDDPNWLLWNAHTNALEAATAGDLVSARVYSIQAVDLALEDAGLTDDYIVAGPRLAQTMLAMGDLEVARHILGQLESRPIGLPAAGLRAYEQAIRGAIGLRTGEDLETAEAALAAGIEQLASYGAVPDRALFQEMLGRWQIDQGRSDEGRLTLEEARSTFADLGAVAWTARVDAALSDQVTTDSV